MRMSLALALLAVLLAGLAWIRLAPADPARWHVDPLTVATPVRVGHALLRPAGGDAAAPVWDITSDALLAAFDRVARAQPRVSVLAGSVDEGQITYVVRSRIIGFPDYVSVRALPAGHGGSTLAIFARQRFGRDDLGVNRTRTAAWLAALPPGAVTSSGGG
ncbi:MAG: DUF1499 domain-containing protein [Mangrovicoccus sp.]|nr:DUF1499 domain-containing protein [Mangrovicoccus sp.]